MLRGLTGALKAAQGSSTDFLLVADVQVIPAVCKVLSLGGDLIVLIKPQFEAKREQISRGGLVRDPAVHDEVIDKVRRYPSRDHPFVQAQSGHSRFEMVQY